MDFRAEVLLTVIESLDVNVMKELKKKDPEAFEHFCKLIKETK